MAPGSGGAHGGARRSTRASVRASIHGGAQGIANGSAPSVAQDNAHGSTHGAAHGGAPGRVRSNTRVSVHGAAHGGTHSDARSSTTTRPSSHGGAAASKIDKLQLSNSLDSLKTLSANVSDTTGYQFYGHLLPGTPYRLGKRLGTGHFGHVRLVWETESGEELAAKLEPDDVKPPQLVNEWEFYEVLGKTSAVGIPSAYYYGKFGSYNVLVLELLGPSLEQMFVMCGRDFSLHTIFMIAVQLIKRLESVHSCHIAHRDIKPHNFLICRPPKKDQTIYIVDFGLSKYFFDEASQRHIAHRPADTWVGTPRYMSLNAHMGFEQSRKDDLESLGYSLIYFLRGTLPWQQIETESYTNLAKRILDVKRTLSLEEICAGQPELIQYMQYVRKLEFSQTPDYNYLRTLFTQRMYEEHYNPEDKMDWSSKISEKARIRKMQRKSL